MMKKTLTVLFVLLGFIISISTVSLNAKNDTNLDTRDACAYSLEGKCSCGGDLQYTSKAYTVKKKCVSCHGKGKLRSGVDKNGKTYYETCTTCHGKGYWLDWQPGYKCRRCGKIYR